eukprot:TRINITY_DN16773_c0_g1_i4.p1 TRINITY_DN16773_c0_g1~~TRINITY_DN16773_c0_g1_i4.p1  ORF type:complete len:283 (-),score=22.72 TRINITY_DN16773_c0_g1_i4:300-1148(-)
MTRSLLRPAHRDAAAASVPVHESAEGSAAAGSDRTYGAALESILEEYGNLDDSGTDCSSSPRSRDGALVHAGMVAAEAEAGAASAGVAGGAGAAAATVEGLTERVVRGLWEVVEGKAALCDDVAVRALFTLNNAVVLQRVTRHVHLPQQYRTLLVQTHLDRFICATVEKVSQVLPSQEASERMSHSQAEKSLQAFNKAFERLSLQQLSWPIIDDDCRVALRTRLAAEVSRMYSDFVEPHMSWIQDSPAFRLEPSTVERLNLKTFFPRLGHLLKAPGMCDPSS